VLFTFPSRYWFTIGLLGVFSLAGWSPLIHTGFLVSRATQDTAKNHNLACTGLSPSVEVLSNTLPVQLLLLYRSPTTPTMHCYITGLGFCAFARHYSRNHSCFLFLRVLRCFSSPRLPPSMKMDDTASLCRVAPLGYPRIIGYLHLPVASRSLSRPSSPPRA
jgi:hypothetical protein